MLGGVALAVAGCGTGRKAAPGELQLERADLAAVAHALISEEPAVGSEVSATRAAWPSIADGLPANTSAISRPALRAATERGAALTLPEPLSETETRSLTGPATGLAGIFRAFVILASRGWQLIGGSIDQIEHGSHTAARFARANVALYIDSVYDAHYSLSQIGKQVPIDYKRLGGATAFGASLTPAEVAALVAAYSEANDRLYPHAGVRLGS